MYKASRKYNFDQVWHEYRNTILQKNITMEKMLDVYSCAYDEYKRNENQYEDRPDIIALFKKISSKIIK